MNRYMPLRSLVDGLLAGAVGSVVHRLFLVATPRVAPLEPRELTAPPEMAARIAALAQRSLSWRGRQTGGHLLHLAIGTAWGALYGAAVGSREPVGPAGATAFSLAVWAVGDGLLIPGFRLGAPLSAYSVRAHAYAIGNHLVYGAAVWGVFRLLRRPWLRGPSHDGSESRDALEPR